MQVWYFDTFSFLTLVSGLFRFYLEMDIINMSIGTGSGYRSGPIAVLADSIVARGVSVIVSAGNDGADVRSPLSLSSVGIDSYSNLTICSLILFPTVSIAYRVCGASMATAWVPSRLPSPLLTILRENTTIYRTAEQSTHTCLQVIGENF